MDEHYYFSREQYFSNVKRGVVELDDKVFKIYTQGLLHYRRETNNKEALDPGASSEPGSVRKYHL